MAFYSGRTIKPQTKKGRPVLGIFLFLLALLTVGGVYAYNIPIVQQKISLYKCYADVSLSSAPYGTSGGIIPVTIPTGSDMLVIGKVLQNQGAIASAYDFACYVNKIKAGEKIQAGYYEIQTPISLEQLVPTLQDARIPTVDITIFEGLRADEIADKLDTAFSKDNGIKKFDKVAFLKLTTSKDVINKVQLAKGKPSLEGFLFPDTYEFYKNATAEDVLKVLLDTYQTKVMKGTDIGKFQAAVSPYNVMVLASIVQKEAGRTMDEKQTIAGIFIKRLKAGWTLGSDVTSLYEKKDWKAVLTQQDLASTSPYNTRNHLGLPPTPICSPALASIQAVLTPKENTPYWFFIYDTKGVVHYAKTAVEHQQNINIYLH